MRSEHLCLDLQDLACRGDDPIAALSSSGIYASDSAVHYLTPAQRESAINDLREMEETFSPEVTAWTLSYKLTRAKVANRKL